MRGTISDFQRLPVPFGQLLGHPNRMLLCIEHVQNKRRRGDRLTTGKIIGRCDSQFDRLRLQFAEHDFLHVKQRNADEDLQQLIRDGAAAERTEQLGIDGVLQQLAVDQHPVAIEDEQLVNFRPRL